MVTSQAHHDRIGSLVGIVGIAAVTAEDLVQKQEPPGITGTDPE
jgi:hypothetical protein